MLLTETAALGLIRAGTDPMASDLLKLNFVVVLPPKVELKPIVAKMPPLIHMVIVILPNIHKVQLNTKLLSLLPEKVHGLTPIWRLGKWLPTTVTNSTTLMVLHSFHHHQYQLSEDIVSIR